MKVSERAFLAPIQYIQHKPISHWRTFEYRSNLSRTERDKVARTIQRPPWKREPPCSSSLFMRSPKVDFKQQINYVENNSSLAGGPPVRWFIMYNIGTIRSDERYNIIAPRYLRWLRTTVTGGRAERYADNNSPRGKKVAQPSSRGIKILNGKGGICVIWVPVTYTHDDLFSS